MPVSGSRRIWRRPACAARVILQTSPSPTTWGSWPAARLQRAERGLAIRGWLHSDQNVGSSEPRRQSAVPRAPARLGGLDLVVRGHRVEKPHSMRPLARVEVRKVWIQRRESRTRPDGGCLRGGQRVGYRQRFRRRCARRVFHPVIGIVRDADYELFGGNCFGAPLRGSWRTNSARRSAPGESSPSAGRSS